MFLFCNQRMPVGPVADIFLRGYMQKQLLVHRPDENDELQRIDQLTDAWAKAAPRRPPGRGIAPSIASNRIVDSASWVDGVPPEPWWHNVDNLGQEIPAAAAGAPG